MGEGRDVVAAVAVGFWDGTGLSIYFVAVFGGCLFITYVHPLSSLMSWSDEQTHRHCATTVPYTIHLYTHIVCVDRPSFDPP